MQSSGQSVASRMLKGYELSKRQGRPRAVVIGAGVVGLSQAVELLESGCDVCVVADTFSPGTTSDGSGGFWRPILLSMPTDQLHRLCKDSFQKMLALKALYPDIGINFISGYEFYNSPPEAPVWSDIVFGFRRAELAEITNFCPHATHGFFYTTLMVEPTKYLNFLMDRVKNLGGTFEQKRLSCLADAAMVFVRNRDTLTSAHRPDFIVNCSGLGASALVPDTKVFPIRGQILRVIPKLPSDSRYFLVDLTDKGGASYVLPREDGCILGGTEQHNDRRTEIDPADTVSIRRRVDKMLPSLKDALVQSQWAGLRPSRESIRLEIDPAGISGPYQSSGDGGVTPYFLPVLHNYGHGGSGMTIHWGCATESIRVATNHGLIKTVCKL